MNKAASDNEYSTGSVLIALDYLLSIGLDAEQWLEEQGIACTHLHQPETRLDHTLYTSIWQTLLDHTGDHNLGLHAGENLNILNGNILSQLAANSATLEAALKNICQFHDIMASNPQPTLIESGSDTLFALNFHHQPSTMARQTSECMFASMLTVIRQMMREPISPQEVCFTHSQPEHHTDVESFFCCPVKFQCEKTSMRFSAEQLAMTVPFANAEFLETMQLHAAQLLKKLRSPKTWSDRVECELISAILSAVYDINTIASSLAVSTRKLQQKLKEENTNFKSLLDKVRTEIAIDHLQQGKTSIAELANLLGFSEQSAFNHAFKRWTGKTPSNYGKP